jgi:hypothetical protein
MSIVPTTEVDGPTEPRVLASVTKRSSKPLTLRSPVAPTRPFSHVRFSVSSVTEIARLAMFIIYHIYIVLANSDCDSDDAFPAATPAHGGMAGFRSWFVRQNSKIENAQYLPISEPSS